MAVAGRVEKSGEKDKIFLYTKKQRRTRMEQCQCVCVCVCVLGRNDDTFSRED